MANIPCRPNAQPGEYRLGWDRYFISFRVADYRKPEINLQVSFDAEEALIGQALTAKVEARYFYDAPASDVPCDGVCMPKGLLSIFRGIRQALKICVG